VLSILFITNSIDSHKVSPSISVTSKKCTPPYIGNLKDCKKRLGDVSVVAKGG